MMQKSTRCLARHPSSTLKNLEMAVLILELEFRTACLGMLSTLECIWNVKCFYFLFSSLYISNTIHSGWYLKYIHEKWNIPFKRISDYGTRLECISLIGQIFQIHFRSWIVTGKFLECIWTVKQFVRVYFEFMLQFVSYWQS